MKRKEPKRMTLHEFYAAIKKLDRKWRLFNGCKIRTHHYLCPIEALASARKIPNNNLWEAGRHMGLTDPEVSLIVYAADDDKNRRYKLRKIRQRLLEACGLAGVR